MRRLLERMRGTRLIVDRERRLGATAGEVTYDVGANKEEVARGFVFSRPGDDLRFLDVGARDGRLDYLLGIRENLDFDQALYEHNIERFRAKYEYWGFDVESAAKDDERVIVGDMTDPGLVEVHPEYREFFDVVYSNNVFEHLSRPWIAADNILQMLKPGGICITIAPFALRYHESPGDHFRYTHTGLSKLFEASSEVKTLYSAYDIAGRRNDWQGTGVHQDYCPVDKFGAWRENWFVVNVIEKP